MIGFAESDRRLVAHGAAARAYGRRALIRLRAGQDRAGPGGSTTAVERIWRFTSRSGGVRPAGGRGDVCCPADVRAAEPRVRHLLDWARRHAWRSVTVAAGGMPATLSRLPTDEPIQLDRWDWQLWRRLADAGVHYGDYGVRPAVPGTGDPGDRWPTVRYTDHGSWWVYRWARRVAGATTGSPTCVARWCRHRTGPTLARTSPGATMSCYAGPAGCRRGLGRQLGGVEHLAPPGVRARRAPTPTGGGEPKWHPGRGHRRGAIPAVRPGATTSR
ncbi:hypothetical protein NKG94_27910 [Micromonospora sp. M12]